MSSLGLADEHDVADFSMEQEAQQPLRRRPMNPAGPPTHSPPSSLSSAALDGDAVGASTGTARSPPPLLHDGMLRDTDGLAVQDLAKLNLDTLAVDSLEVMSRQATVNVGTIGHVAHGKSTVVKALSGVKTQKYHREAVMNITIHLGYANAKVFQCAKCPRPSCFQTYPSSQPDATPCPTCGEMMTLRRHFSFVDCPGHDVLMATMLNGAAIMDAALLLIAANESFPQPQTIEHLAAAEMMRVAHLIVLQNKMDLVAPPLATAQYDVIRRYLAAKTRFAEAPIIPLCAQLGANIHYLLDYLVHVPLPQRNLTCPHALLHVLRSFDVSRPGELVLEGDHDASDEEGPSSVSLHRQQRRRQRPHVTTSVSNPEEVSSHEDDDFNVDEDDHTTTTTVKRTLAEWLPGGVVGGTVERGVLCLGDVIEFLPGMLSLTSRTGHQRPTKVSVLRGQTLAYLSAPPPGELFAVPLRTTVESLKAERNVLQYALPGGLVAVGTNLDPSLTRQSKLRGQVMRVVQSRLHEGARTGAAAAAPPPPPPPPVTGSSLSTTAAPWQVYQELDIQFYLLKELLGLSHADLAHAAKARYPNGLLHNSNGPYVESYRVHPQHTQSLHNRVKPLREGDSIVVNVGTLSTAATVLRTARGVGRALVRLESPICAEPGQKIVLARYVEKKVRLIGWGSVKRGVPVPILE